MAPMMNPAVLTSGSTAVNPRCPADAAQAAARRTALAPVVTLAPVEEGRIREAVLHDGRFHDELTMGLLASEWHATHG